MLWVLDNKMTLRNSDVIIIHTHKLLFYDLYAVCSADACQPTVSGNVITKHTWSYYSRVIL